MNINLFRFLAVLIRLASLHREKLRPARSRRARRAAEHRRRRCKPQGIQIPPPPVISPTIRRPAPRSPTTRSASFLEGILRAGQLESTCDDCADGDRGLAGVNPSTGCGELDPDFPAVQHQLERPGRAPQCRSVLRLPRRSRRSAAPAASSCRIRRLARRPPRAAGESAVRLCSASLRQAERGAELRAAVRADPRSALHLKVDDNGDFIPTARPPDGGVHQLWIVRGIQRRSHHPELPHRAAGFREAAARRTTCRSAFRCR